MRKQLLSVSLITIFAAYAYHQAAQTQEAVAVVSTTTPSSDVSNPLRASSEKISPAPSLPKRGTPSGKFHDGSFTGTVADAFYGNLQVKATIVGGKLTDVAFVQFPNDRPTSRQISQQALPILRQEAIQAQSAQVDGVTGASATSQAFTESLDSALTKAQQ